MNAVDPGSVAQQIQQAVRKIDWARYDSAEPTEVEYAFNRLVQARTEADAPAAYDAVLNVLAHNHSGWVWACAVPAAPILARVVADCTGIPRRVAPEILVDLVSWSTAGSADSDEVGQALRAAAGTLTPLLNRLATSRQNKAATRLAHDLLDALNA